MITNQLISIRPESRWLPSDKPFPEIALSNDQLEARLPSQELLTQPADTSFLEEILVAMAPEPKLQEHADIYHARYSRVRELLSLRNTLANRTMQVMGFNVWFSQTSAEMVPSPKEFIEQAHQDFLEKLELINDRMEDDALEYEQLKQLREEAWKAKDSRDKGSREIEGLVSQLNTQVGLLTSFLLNFGSAPTPTKASPAAAYPLTALIPAKAKPSKTKPHHKLSGTRLNRDQKRRFIKKRHRLLTTVNHSASSSRRLSKESVFSF